MRVLAYVYPGWHPIPERDESFYPGFTEWDLVEQCRPRFEGHAQPKVPLWGRYDDRDPAAMGKRLAAARDHGIDGIVVGTFWCRGKRVFEDALDLGILGSPEGQAMPFACMWANRMPRRVLPVKRADLPVIDPSRLVPTDVDDFVAFVRLLAEQYFTRSNYLRVDGKAYFSIFDSTFFASELGFDGARAAITAAREMLRSGGFPELHLAAIEPAAHVIGDIKALGFDSVTHYVFMPDWRGELLQDYAERSAIRAAEWPAIATQAGLPYHPSVTPGWDASPRAADFAELGRERPDKYPWSPVVVGESPEQFRIALERALAYARGNGDLVFIASLNEWSEGNYLEPDSRFGTGWLEAVRAARTG